MTLANKITIGRILLIPVFVGCAVYYAQSVKSGTPVEVWRWAAIASFVVAAASDGVDGFIARRFHQRSRLGRLLDPLADKGLLLSAIITLSLTPWPWKFPLWFPLLVIARDGICIAATFVINFVTGHVEIQPHWTGKVATFLQMVAIGWVLVEWRRPDPLVPTILAGVFTFISGTIYFRDGLRQLRASEHAYPEQPLPSDDREM